MGALDWVASKLGYAKPRRSTGYAAAELSRLTSSLAAETEQINNTLRYQLPILRARSRQASMNNPYVRRFAQMVVDNVCGPVPFRLQSKVKFKSGSLDTAANAKIEACWKSWSRKGNCELTGRWSWAATQRLLVRSLAVDGELLVRIKRGDGNGPHQYMLQVLDADRLDDRKNEKLANGGAIHMGVELDPLSRPVAYHILKRKPATWSTGGYPRESERVPAEDILHFFIPDFPEQVRGVPWIYAALLNLVHIGAFAEAAVIAARIGASQMGFIQSPDGGATLVGDGKDAAGNPQMDAEPGTFRTLPPGYEVGKWDPKYPDAAIEPFLKACLRGVAVGVNVAYHNLAGDMNGVNYSSARIAELDERDGWMTVQSYLCEHVHEPIAADWLRVQVLVSGQLSFPADRLDKYREFYFQGRRWQWVDPRNEVEANLAAIAGRIKSRTRVIAEQGEDIEDVFDEIAEEEKLADGKGIELEASAPASPGKPAEETTDENQDAAKVAA